ncbi:MAG: trypsin-like serine protease [Desulfobulbus sp.]
MVTTAASYTLENSQASAGQGFDGVVRVVYDGHYGTGTLLYDGRAVVTAAHLFRERSGTATISFETLTGVTTITSADITIHPGYDPVNGNNDLALVWLNHSAPVTAERYPLYRESDAIGKEMTLVGYGTPGIGANGTDESYTGPPLRLKAKNTFDAEGTDLSEHFGTQLSWTPLPGTQLLADFDNGTNVNDAIGKLLGVPHPGLGISEGLISPGDSGGPAFIEAQLAGIASYTTSLSTGLVHPDIDSQLNSSFGEIAAWQNISSYQSWIDQSLRAQYIDAPKNAKEVQTQVWEGNSGTSLVYFLLEFTGIRNQPTDILSVEYTTRDGTAVAGEDYLATIGTLNLYPGETEAVIAVEIIGDTKPESNETFFLDVFNPVGGSFGEGVVKLTAVRTILDDDWIG